MTYCLFIDEKGPQSKTRYQDKTISNKDNDPSHKIKIADDQMMTYFAVGFLIKKERLQDFEDDFLKIEDYYKPHFFKNKNTVSELKGAKILKKKTSNGFASLTTDIVKFYNELFKLVNKYDAKLCVLTESKAENIIGDMLNNSAFDKGVDQTFKKLNLPNSLENTIKIEAVYSLIKLFTDEPSGNIVKVLNTDSFSINETFTAMIKDLKSRIEDFEIALNDLTAKDDPQRVSSEVTAYYTLIDILENAINQLPISSEVLLSDNIGNFDWQKIVKQLHLFLIKNKINTDSVLFFLDEGIKKNNFDDLHVKKFNENVDSKTCPGIRMCDLMVTLIGSIATNLSKRNRYNPHNPLNRVLTPPEWFKFNNRNQKFENGENHFKLTQNLNSKLNKNIKYYGNIFNDDLFSFQSYTNILSQFRTYTELTNYSIKNLQNIILVEFVRLQELFFSKTDNR